MKIQSETKRGPGRPPGAKNKPKNDVEIDSDDETYDQVLLSSEGEFPETVDDVSEAIEPEPEIIEITITIPVMRPPKDTYLVAHIDYHMNRTERTAHRWLFDALIASDESIQRLSYEREVRDSPDVERWLMQKIADALPPEAFAVKEEGEESESAS